MVGWKSFLSELDAAQDWLETTTYHHAMQEVPAAGRVYLPTSSYEEMEEWCLPPARSRELHSARQSTDPSDVGAVANTRSFLRGAPWRNMLVRYPESNRLYRRMQATSDQLKQTQNWPTMAVLPEQLHPSVRSLFRAQCNCGYWHGVFGGLYLPFLRDAIAEHTLRARQLQAKEQEEPRATFVDLDGDGRQEVLLEDAHWSLWLSPDRGGLIELLDDRQACLSLVNVLGRHREAYHEDLILPGSGPGEPLATTSAAAPDGDKQAGNPASIHDQSLTLDEFEPEYLEYDRQSRGAFALTVAEPSQDWTSLLALDKVDAPQVEGDDCP